MSNELFDIYAVSIKSGAERVMAEALADENAEAFIKMSVMRRGVDEEFYVKRPHVANQEQDDG